VIAQAHGYPGSSPAGRSPVVLHPNASHGLPPTYNAADSAHFRDIGSGRVMPLVTARDVRMFTGSDPVAPKAD
jgi:hypothetical protein